MPFKLVDYYQRDKFYPFSKLRSIADCRCGILTISERWNLFLKQPIEIITPAYLQPKYQAVHNASKNTNTFININVIPNQKLIDSILAMDNETVFIDLNGFVAAKTEKSFLEISNLDNQLLIAESLRFKNVFDLILFLPNLIKLDIDLIKQNYQSAKIPEHVIAYNSENIFIEPSAKLYHCSLNATDGPIYIGKDVEIMEGVSIRGPFTIAEKGVVKMNATIYGATSIGYHSIVGGEIKNSIIMDFSNKAHHGYLGDSIVGNWCNFGAGSTNSNLKNNFSDINFPFPQKDNIIRIGKKFGCLVGDHTKIAINTAINTGTYIGNCCNLFESKLEEKFINDFMWGNYQRYEINKLLDDINNWQKSKKKSLSTIDRDIIREVFSF